MISYSLQIMASWLVPVVLYFFMALKINLLGQKVGRLTIVKEADRDKRNKIRYFCLCDCGVECIKLRGSILSGRTTSCGCYQKQSSSERSKILNTKHGLSKHPLFNVWRGMKKRCYLETHKAYKSYGGRGIKMCNEWKNDFTVFYEWAMQNGWEIGLQIDRFPDNDGNYEPLNCRITTCKINNTNKRTSVKITYQNETKTASEWGEIYGKHRSNIAFRVKKGLGPEEAIFGVGKGNKFKTKNM